MFMCFLSNIVPKDEDVKDDWITPQPGEESPEASSPRLQCQAALNLSPTNLFN